MMFCRNCGEVLIDTDLACQKCGFAAGDGIKFCASCGDPTNPGAVICETCGKPVSAFSAQPPYGAQQFQQASAQFQQAPTQFQQDPQIRDPYDSQDVQFRTLDAQMRPPADPNYGAGYQGQPQMRGYIPPETYMQGMPGYRPVTYKSKTTAGLLGIFLGFFGVHNFYLGYTNKAVAQLLLTTLGACMGVGPIIAWLWGVVEGILLLTGGINRDGHGNPLGG